MTARLLAVLRRPEMVCAVIGTLDGHRFSEQTIPLSQTHESLCPWRDRDLSAWRALAKVPRMSRRVAATIVRALVATTSEPGAGRENLDELGAGPLPTDLRPHLCTSSGESQIIASLGDSLAAATKGLDFPAWHWTHRANIAQLPHEFRRLFLWRLHLNTWAQVLELLAAYEHLNLESNSDLRSAFARLVSHVGAEDGVAWAGALSETRPEQQMSLAARAIAQGQSRPTEEFLKSAT